MDVRGRCNVDDSTWKNCPCKCDTIIFEINNTADIPMYKFVENYGYDIAFKKMKNIIMNHYKIDNDIYEKLKEEYINQ